MTSLNVTVLGDGGWGTTLAILLSRRGKNVTLWSAFPEYAEFLAKKRE
ncbi:MAG: glycerol-3-phosphate dehydrogenase, partial [Candidatus Omnitrophica bacterium]|nr:glycerol-3-phosphate dehydrogenase [Candidatus Omnitrophota bacterium]